MEFWIASCNGSTFGEGALLMRHTKMRNGVSAVDILGFGRDDDIAPLKKLVAHIRRRGLHVRIHDAVYKFLTACQQDYLDRSKVVCFDDYS
jgi:hypothetical protein